MTEPTMCEICNLPFDSPIRPNCKYLAHYFYASGHIEGRERFKKEVLEKIRQAFEECRKDVKVLHLDSLETATREVQIGYCETAILFYIEKM